MAIDNYGYNAGCLGAIKGAANAATPMASKQPTVASALGRIEGLNGRLCEATKQLAAISDVVGGPRPVSDGETLKDAPSGIVYRLNDGADAAHRQVSEIEELIGTISRALG